jgi:hypothetical protein
MPKVGVAAVGVAAAGGRAGAAAGPAACEVNVLVSWLGSALLAGILS